MSAPSLSSLPSSALTSSIVELRSRQRIDDVQFLWLLAEIDRRKSYEELGHSSLWDFCTRELRLTNGAAGRRINAARLLAKFPAAADFLTDGRLGLMTFGMLKDVLTEENHLQVLRDASCKSESEVDQLVRTHRPLSFTLDTVVRTVSTPVLVPVATTTPTTTPTVGVNDATPPSISLPESSLPPAQVRAVDAEYVSLTIRVSKDFMADLEQVSAALSHIVPSRKPAEVLRECIRRTLDEHAKRRGGLPARKSTTPTAGVTDESSATESTPTVGVTDECSDTEFTPTVGVEERDPRAIPIALARLVWERAQNCCTFVGTNGHQCRSTHQLEIQHRVPVALGGHATLDNLTLHCRRHNLLQARRDFGEDFMRQFVDSAGASP